MGRIEHSVYGVFLRMLVMALRRLSPGYRGSPGSYGGGGTPCRGPSPQTPSPPPPGSRCPASAPGGMGCWCLSLEPCHLANTHTHAHKESTTIKIAKQGPKLTFQMLSFYLPEVGKSGQAIVLICNPAFDLPTNGLLYLPLAGGRC